MNEFEWINVFRFFLSITIQKCEGNLPPEWRKFSVDPQITSLEVLYSILAKAFDLKTDFSISYKTVDLTGGDIFAAVLSDWDLDAAFLRFDPKKNFHWNTFKKCVIIIGTIIRFTGPIIRQSLQRASHACISKWILSPFQRPQTGNRQVIAVPKKRHPYNSRLVLVTSMCRTCKLVYQGS